MMRAEELYAIFRKCGAVSTDSRKVSGGELFFALKGENFDGNRYASKALDEGAAYAVISEDFDASGEERVDEEGRSRLIRVPDTLTSLQELAKYHREHVRPGRLAVIGITGTNGKTTTKELIRCVLATKFNVLATEGNLNNDIGVPLTLLGIAPDTDFAIVEMGASHPDDIANLSRLCEPDYGLITNVGKAHLQGFGSLEGVRRAKGALYSCLSERGGCAFVNADDASLMDMALGAGVRRIVPYGLSIDGAEVMEVPETGPFLRLLFRDWRMVGTFLVGSYNAPNVLAALCVGSFFGVPWEDAWRAVGAYLPSNSRSQMMRTARNLLIVDAYNANPSSMQAALDNFASVVAESKVALLGDMLELGEDSVSEHGHILATALSYGFAQLRLVGEEFRKALEVITSNKKNVSGVRWYRTSEELAEDLRREPLSGSTVLVKGSRGMMMEKVIPEL